MFSQWVTLRRCFLFSQLYTSKRNVFYLKIHILKRAFSYKIFDFHLFETGIAVHSIWWSFFSDTCLCFTQKEHSTLWGTYQRLNTCTQMNIVLILPINWCPFHVNMIVVWSLKMWQQHQVKEIIIHPKKYVLPPNKWTKMAWRSESSVVNLISKILCFAMFLLLYLLFSLKYMGNLSLHFRALWSSHAWSTVLSCWKLTGFLQLKTLCC